jgi:hypothetical protein
MSLGSSNIRWACVVLVLGLLAACQAPGSIKSSGMEKATVPDESRLRARQRSLRFPAFRKGDTAKIDCPVPHLDAGIDRGDVALRRSIDYEPGKSLRAVKKKLLLFAPDLAA